MPESDRGPTRPEGESPDDAMFWEPSVRFLRYAIGFTLLGAVACLAVLLYLVPGQTLRLFLTLLWLPVGLLAWFLVARDKIRPTVMVLCIGVWSQVTLALFAGGVGSTILVVYPLVVLFSGWMIGPRFTVALAALTIALLLFVAARQTSGIPYDLGATTPPLLRGLILGSVVAVSALLIAHLLRAYRQRLAERQRTEEALRDSEERFRSLVALSSDWYWEQDADFRFVAVSDGISGIGGVRDRVPLGLRRWELPDTGIIGQTWEAHRATLSAHQPFRELRLRRTGADGEPRYINVSGEPVFDRAGAFTGYRGVARDVTERVRAGHLARAADERLRRAIEHLDEAISITDGDDRIVIGNRSFRDLNHNTRPLENGHTYEQHLRAGMAVGNYPESAGREEAWLAARLARRRGGGTFEVRRQNGRWLQVSDQHLPGGGVITYSLEITGRKRAEEALKEINADLERRVAERTARLEATYRELESFSYAVSHDLRTPLRAMTGFSTILLKEEGENLSGNGRRLLGIIDANAQRMAKLIDALLALARYTRVDLNRTEVDMEGLAREACGELAACAPRARIVIGALPGAMGNATLLKQVFLNLVGNALKYSANAADPRVEIRAEEGGYVVSDNGAGFDMAFVGKLFQPFERLHTEREFEGTGIGLAIVKLIVERHGGRVAARGVPGEGARFSFTLGPVV